MPATVNPDRHFPLRDFHQRVAQEMLGGFVLLIPSTQAHEAVCGITDAVSLDTWKKSVKPFYETLIGKLEIEESWANAALNKVTA